MTESGSFRLDGRVALVTGAAQGIGRSVALALAAAGATVHAVDVATDALAATAELLGPGHSSELFDLRRTADMDALCEGVAERAGAVDVLAHVAGIIIRRAGLEDVTEADWDSQLSVNLKATFFLDRACARIMRRQGTGGSIVNFASQSWWTGGFGGSVVYAATKGGVVSLTRGLSRSFAPDGIRVNAVAPGAVDTEMMRAGLSEQDRADFVARIPIGRMSSADEVAVTVVFLASDASSSITGTVLNVSGGQLQY